MGPKGYRIAWLGRSEARMASLLQGPEQRLGECRFLAYPGCGTEALKDVYPAFSVVDTEDLEGHRTDLFRWVTACREVSPKGRVLVLAHNGALRSFAEALRRGADWVLPSTGGPEALRFCLDSLIRMHKTERQTRPAPGTNGSEHVFEGMIGKSALMKDLFVLLRKCAPSRTNVLIRGESGTGKELAARALHRLSGRTGNLVVVNCASLMDTLHQSELFGHERGAFTDAKHRRVGYFEAAKEGTLFLDEIGDISPQTQVALLRVIEGMEFFRVGGSEAVRVDVRIVSATNRNLMERVEQGRFREDLYYRLNGFCLTIPPLRDRQEDIPLLAQNLLDRYALREGKPVTGFTNEALNMLTTYRWPGNVRELDHEIQRLLIHVDDERLISSGMLVPPINVLKNLPSYRPAGSSTLKERMQQAEAFFIKEALKQRYGNRTRAARQLGISREGLHKKMARYQIR